jgi:tetratricopeptide (TPR) repeat protein
MQVKEKSDIFCDIIIDSISEIGDETKLDDMNSQEMKKFSEVKESVENALACAKDKFKQKQFKDSVRIFESVRSRLQWTKSADEEERSEKIEILLKSILNIAICYLALENHRKAMETLETYEGINENADQNVKFLYTKGKAYYMNGDYKEAKSTLKQALTIQPCNTEVSDLLEKLKVSEEEHSKKEKEIMKNMFK